MRKVAADLITFYQIYLSFDRGLLRMFVVGRVCKYPVSCSEFTKQAIMESGVLKGSWLGFNRILSCR